MQFAGKGIAASPEATTARQSHGEHRNTERGGEKQQLHFTSLAARIALLLFEAFMWRNTKESHNCLFSS